MRRSMLAFLFASLAVLPAALPAQTVDTVGGMNSAPVGANRGKLNLFTVNSTVLLIEFEMHLNVPAPDTLTFIAYRHHSRNGAGTLLWQHQVAVPGGIGAAWYSTGPIALPLVGGNHYAIGCYWAGNLTYYYNTATAGSPVSFGNWQRAHTVTGSIPPTITFTGSDIAQYYQRLTTVPVTSVVNTGTGCSGTALIPRLVASDFFSVNTTTQLELVDAAAVSIGLFALGVGPALPAPLPLFGCSIWVDPALPIVTLAALTTGGYAALPIAVPNDPLLSGQTFSSQALVFGTTIDVTNAVSFTIN